MVSSVGSVELLGIGGFAVQVEIDITQGMPGFEIVGLPDAAVREARERVRSAARNSGFELPTRRITANLSPADRRKEGSTYDLALALGILRSAGAVDFSAGECCFVGELSLDGRLQTARGILPMACAAAAAGFRELIVPAANAAEAALAGGIRVYGAATLKEAVEHVSGVSPLAPVAPNPEAEGEGGVAGDFSEVRGQERVKRALEIAAAGGHNLLLIGPPGAGKSMLAKRLPGILPAMSREESLEVTMLHSVAGLLEGGGLVTRRPFRSPHHTMSQASLVGGGRVPKPGELSLAHNGVLFLDELPEFDRMALESLRQPIEDGQVTIARVGGRVSYPSRVMLVCAMNPCRCGYFGHPTRPCTCRPDDVRRYLGRVSGPILDRMDLQVEVPAVSLEELSAPAGGERSADVRVRVESARAVQRARLGEAGGRGNAALPPAALREIAPLDPACRTLLAGAFEKLGLSARGYDRILRVARTIADLAGARDIAPAHLAEAIQLRSLDRKFW